MADCEEGLVGTARVPAPMPVKPRTIFFEACVLGLLGPTTLSLIIPGLVGEDLAVKSGMGLMWSFMPWATMLFFTCLVCGPLAPVKKVIPSLKTMVLGKAIPEPTADGVRLVFDDHGMARTVYAKYRPLGIVHAATAPNVVSGFSINSYAKAELGVQVGWRLTCIGDADLVGGLGFEGLTGALHKHMRDLPVWPLPLQFAEQHSSEPKMIEFVERPLGLVFNPRSRTEVHDIHDNSPAQREGVQPGWRLTKIGDYDVHENHGFSELITHLKRAIQPLDEAGKISPGIQIAIVN
uniref:PDZ domain-containing protein n=1 Tax=Pyrodinium bahamense TaxID=73915 RepID=A0A7S0FHV0_9DINO